MSAKIGLEIHCQLTTLNSKLFCACRADYRGMAPNTNVCATCMGLPGTLPRLNGEAVRRAAAIALSLGCEVPGTLRFFRKNYFYPDLPKNYQITQLDLYGPSSVGHGGSVAVGDRTVSIERVQLEEDPGRIVYGGEGGSAGDTLVDYNRAGTPLVEIVTGPDMRGAREVREFLGILHDMLENLGVSDTSLEGAMRADANVSIEGGNRVEIKNVTSFHDIGRAVEYEIARQAGNVEHGLETVQETRQWDERRRTTVGARSKEADQDYRYLIEHDIPPVGVSGAVAQIRASLPESIASRRRRYAAEDGMQAQVADVLSSEPHFARLYDAARTGENSRELANIITTDLMGLLETREAREASRLAPAELGALALAVSRRELTRASAKAALQSMVRSGATLAETVDSLGLRPVDDAGEIARAVEEVMAANPKAVADARASPAAVNHVMGLVMRRCGGRADPATARSLIEERLRSHDMG
ncbi:MAG: Asp-tRNA(Asn)/Glu-tRNA(Gln) amidotransferase subunit GatB [Thaumarchaeota archaeon]|nr:Asp-tRNA(Asn)/Glu-tRNA(Gln) amidotransferase subunit GatB [Nitrososphaerota archaeon]